ncbi:MAG: hypothetical protein JXR48_09735 [Candidatus Delongbacteria bacterium]|nr:hypothetical protein [Candidatus Delongbacteria bacterium]MBN2835234.1 hypothetical protein [Candidatus Delongbacteria bacterium]
MKKINELTILIVNILFLASVIFTKSTELMLLNTLSSLMVLILMRKLQYSYLLFFLLFMIPALFSVFITGLLFNDSENSNIIFTIFSFSFSDEDFKTAIFLSTRSFTISFISFSYIIHIDHEKLILSMMQNLKLPINLGYSLLIMFNSFYNLKDDYARIRSAYLIKTGKKIPLVKTLIPLLVNAARFAQNAGLSLEVKNLRKDKTFIHMTSFKNIDYIAIGLTISNILTVYSVYHL